MRGKRGWIRIVEAVVALLIITGALLIAITGGYLRKDISADVYDSELAILREVAKDQDMRNAIIGIVDESAIEWERFDDIDGLSEVKSKIESRVPPYLECKARICALDRICEIDEESKSIYARSVAITATAQEYNPKQLKLFCWEKT
ncbi:hypothetical protein KAR91_32155 [Candidatus Pacearchaeota archaeon]|nr:hypothetical protein [Candidatus Pacearchaeota archaeon]